MNYGRSDPRHYGRLVAITADELHAVDPKIRVACNFAGYHDWARGVAKEAAGHADVYTFHPYPWVGGAGSIHLTDEQILVPYANFLKQALRQSSGQAGAAVKWANTEYACYQLMGAAIWPDGYTFEIKFPRSAIPGFKFEKGAKMGFALQIGDQDQTSMFGSRETGAAKTTMLWGGEIGVAGDPSQFGTIIFGGP